MQQPESESEKTSLVLACLESLLWPPVSPPPPKPTASRETLADLLSPTRPRSSAAQQLALIGLLAALVEDAGGER